MLYYQGRLLNHGNLVVSDLDPDGNNVEAVYPGPAQRSAPSVVLTPTMPVSQ